MRTAEDTAHVVDFLTAGLYADDAALFSGFVTWQPIFSPPGVFWAATWFPALFPALDLLGTQPTEVPALSTPAAGGRIRPRRREEFGDRPPTETMTYSLKITTAARSASVRIAGDLDYQTAGDLVEVASRLLAQQNPLSDLHLDFSELAFLDSAALSGLLVLHRRASQAGVALHLDHRPQFLDRVLQMTGLFEHFDLTRSDAETGDPRLLGQASSGESGAR
jgi:anti-anti-sigma factor